MGTIIRFLVSAPLAALVTVVTFLALYNQLSPKPFLYKVREEPGKLYFSLSEEHAPIWVCDCITFIPLPYKSETDNPWTNSEKAVKEPPALSGEETPTLTIDIDSTHHDNLHHCDVDVPILELRPPPYPAACRKKSAEGPVTVRFDISKEGRPINIVILQSPDNCFNAPVFSSIERRRYPPYCTSDGIPAMKAGVTETFTFALED